MARKIVSFVLCVIMVFGLAQSVSAADSTVASTLRLEKATGTVTLKNKNGKALTPRDGIKLYHGYTIATGASSYAYISLDSSKIIKIDASSSVEVRQSGKNLEVYLISGNLFFNVTKPVAADATLNIRTSTMVTGIRGTAGYLCAVSNTRTEFSLLEGKVTLWTTDKETGLVTSRVVVAGQKAIAMRTETAQGQPAEDVTIIDYRENDVPGYVAVEVKESVPLQEKISEETTLDVPTIIGEAEKKLENEEQAAQKKEEAIQQQVENLVQQQQAEEKPPVDSLFNPPEAAPVEDPPIIGSTPARKPTTNIITTDVDCPTLNHYLRYYDIVIIDAGATATVLDGEVLNVAPTNTLIIIGELHILGGGSIVNNGRIVRQ